MSGLSLLEGFIQRFGGNRDMSRQEEFSGTAELLAMRQTYLAETKGVNRNTDFGDMTESEEIAWLQVQANLMQKAASRILSGCQHQTLDETREFVVLARQTYSKAMGESPCPDNMEEWDTKCRVAWLLTVSEFMLSLPNKHR